jgi:hypothetical protein
MEDRGRSSRSQIRLAWREYLAEADRLDRKLDALLEKNQDSGCGRLASPQLDIRLAELYLLLESEPQPPSD